MILLLKILVFFKLCFYTGNSFNWAHKEKSLRKTSILRLWEHKVVLWRSDEHGSHQTLGGKMIQPQSQFMKEQAPVAQGSFCYFDPSTVCSSGRRCKVDGRPCSAKRTYLSESFRTHTNLLTEHEENYPKTSVSGFKGQNEGFIEKVERVLRGETHRKSGPKSGIHSNHKKLEHRCVKRESLTDETSIDCMRSHYSDVAASNDGSGWESESESDHPYIITSANVVQIDWDRLKHDLLPKGFTKNVFRDSMTALGQMAQLMRVSIRNLFYWPFGPAGLF